MSDLSDATRYVQPVKLPPGSKRLPDDMIRQWKEEGYCLVHGLLPAEVVEGVVREARGGEMKGSFGSGGEMEFPTEHEVMNGVTVDEGVLGCVRQLIGDDVLLSQSDTWVKMGDSPYNTDQRIHMDYPNHTLTHPPAWHSPEAVALIIYYSDASDCDGRTSLIPRTSDSDPNYVWPYTNMPGFGATPWKNPKEEVESMLAATNPPMAQFRTVLYENEKYADFTAGTILFYRHDIWHRGTPVRPGAVRVVQNLVFKKADCRWVNQWNPGTARQMYTPNMTVEKLIATCSVSQRNVLGFPPPEHDYWKSPENLEAVRQRYGPLGMDLTPYER